MTFRSICSRAAAALFAAAAITPVAHAQEKQFQGVVTFRTEKEGNLQYSLGYDKIRVDMSRDNHQAAMIMDPKSHTMYMLMPERKVYMQMEMHQGDSAKAQDSKASKVTLTKLGKSEVIAGHNCEDWRVHDEEGGDTDVCAATDMGAFLGAHSPMRHGGAPPAWQREIGSRNFFPLKVVTHRDGKEVTVLEATKIEPKALDESLFAPPSSYQKMDMSNMQHMGGHH